MQASPPQREPSNARIFVTATIPASLWPTLEPYAHHALLLATTPCTPEASA